MKSTQYCPALALSLLVSAAFADQVTNQWLGVSADWNAVENWSLGTLPDTETVVQFPPKKPTLMDPAIDGHVAVHGVRVNEDYTYDWTIGGAGSLTIGESGLIMTGQKGVTTFAVDIVLDGDQIWRGEPNGNNGCAVQLLGSLSGRGSLILEQWNRSAANADFKWTLGDGIREMAPSDLSLDGSIKVRGYATATIDLGPQNVPADFVLSGTLAEPKPFFSELPGKLLLNASSSSGAEVRILSPLSASADGTVLWVKASGTQPPTITFPAVGELGGPMMFYRNQTMNEALGPFDFSGTWTLPQDRGVVGSILPAPQGYSVHEHSFAGSIVDGPGSWANPLVLMSPAMDFTLLAPAEAMTYAHGTVVDHCGTTYNDRFASARIHVGADSRLGTGDLTILPGGSVLLETRENLAEGARVDVRSSSVALGYMHFSDGDFSRLTPTSHGVISFKGAQTEELDLSTIGDGRCFLGSLNGNSYRGNALLPAADGVWRLGGGTWGNILNFEKASLHGDGRLQVGAPVWHGNGTVILNGANTFTGPTDVYGISVFSREPDLQNHTYVGGKLTVRSPASGNPLGNTDQPLTLHNAQVMFQLSYNVPLYVKDLLAFEGRSQVCVDCNIRQEDFTLGEIQRLNRGFLTLYPGRNRLGGYERLHLDTLPADFRNGIFPVWFHEERNRKFLTYDAELGVVAYTPSVTSLAASTPTDVVSIGATTLTADAECYALAVNGALSGGKTVHVGAGGLLLPDAAITANFDFGDEEALIFSISKFKAINGTITARNGLSIAGKQLSSLADNAIEGPITVNGGSFFINPDSHDAGHSLGTVTNPIVLNGGALVKQENSTGDRLLVSRTITLGTAGGMLSGKGLTVESKVTGPGMLMIGSSASAGRSGEVILAHPENDYTGGTFLLSPGGNGGPGWLTVRPESSVGSGDVLINSEVWATFEGDCNLAPTAMIQVALLGKAYFTSRTPAVGRLAGAGDVYLGNAEHDTTLTLGGAGQDFTFYGRIRDGAGASNNVVRKIGAGIFTLYGNHDFTGTLEVDEGTLDLRASLAGSLLVEEQGTLHIAVDDDGLTTHPAHVDGDVILAGELQLGLPASARPAFGTSYPILTTQGSIDKTHARIPAGFRLHTQNDSLLLTYTGEGTLLLVR